MQASWTAGSMSFNTKVGLFGVDMADFWAACATATTYCDYHSYYANYDGWALGQAWYLDSLSDMQAATGFEWITASGYSVATCWATTEECNYITSHKSALSYGNYLGLGYSETLSASTPANLASISNVNPMSYWDGTESNQYGFSDNTMWSNLAYDGSNSFTQIWPSGELTFFRFQPIDDNDKRQPG